MPLSSDQLPILQSFPGFARLTAEELALVANVFETMSVPAGKDLFRQGEAGKYLYLVASGQARLYRNGAPLQLVRAGEMLGEDALLGHPRHGTARVESDLLVLRASVRELRFALRTLPGLHRTLRTMVRGRRLASPARFRWLAPDEIVYLASRKTGALLVPSLLIPGLLAVFSIGSAAVFLSLGLPTHWLILSSVGLVVSALLGGWQAVDWSNDYYLVTNRRAVVIQRVPFIYDDRQETPLAMIQSVSFTRSLTQRMTGCGDVTLRTFTKPITFPSIPQPELVTHLIEEIWKREQNRHATNEREEIEAVLAGRLREGDAESDAEDGIEDSQAEHSMAIGFAQTRFENGATITYRKHLFFAARDTFLPALLAATGVGIFLFALVGVFPGEKTIGMVIGALVGLVGILWGWYEYIDWANDLYQVTTDQILAIHRKPLGDEERRSAALENILSLEYDRPGLLARLLNFGTVIATVGQVNFSFDQVQDPVGVQEDIFRRMEKKRQKRSAGQRQERREEFATWIETYHRMTHFDPPDTEEKA